jgi:hypothetical protein
MSLIKRGINSFKKEQFEVPQPCKVLVACQYIERIDDPVLMDDRAHGWLKGFYLPLSDISNILAHDIQRFAHTPVWLGEESGLFSCVDTMELYSATVEGTRNFYGCVFTREVDSKLTAAVDNDIILNSDRPSSIITDAILTYEHMDPMFQDLYIGDSVSSSNRINIFSRPWLIEHGFLEGR